MDPTDDLRRLTDLDGLITVSFDELHACTAGFSDLLGSGGTGDVFRGSIDGLPVAVKRLNVAPGASAQTVAQIKRRFWAELRALSGVRHVRLVHLRGYSLNDDVAHPCALIFELLDGGSLADWLRSPAGHAPRRRTGEDADGAGSCSLPVAQRLDIAVGVAAGLAFLHGRGEDESAAGKVPAVPAAGSTTAAASPSSGRVLLHRDVKSANIGLAMLPGGGVHAKLLDLGLASAVRGGDSSASGGAGRAGGVVAYSGDSITNIGAGTPGYTAPELGDLGPSVQTEVYAFGIVLLELLMGQRVDPRALRTLLDDVWDADAAAAPAIVAARAEAGVWPAPVATALAELIVACTQRSVRRRLPDISAAAARLRAIQALLQPAAPALVTCDACLEDVSVDQIIDCPAPHAAGASAVAHVAHRICSACLQRHVSTIEAIAIDMNDGCVPCPSPSCGSPGWTIEALAPQLDHRTLALLTSKIAVLTKAARDRLAFEQAMQDKLDRGLGRRAARPSSAAGSRASSGAAAAAAVGGAGALPVDSLAERAALLADVVRERDLTLHCPRCALPYAEVVGCNAVLCGSRDRVTGVDLLLTAAALAFAVCATGCLRLLLPTTTTIVKFTAMITLIHRCCAARVLKCALQQPLHRCGHLQLVTAALRCSEQL